jgi:hypothetical protein
VADAPSHEASSAPDHTPPGAAFESALHCGCVKVVLHDLPLAAWFGPVGDLGYVFDRRHDRGSDVRLEFYSNLYASQTTDAADSRSVL